MTVDSRRADAKPHTNTVSRIGLVDDHAVVGLGLRTLLADHPDLEFVAAETTVAGLLAGTADLDVVLLDLRLADGSSVWQNISRLRQTGAEVLAYTSGDDVDLVRAAARAGIAGMVRKSEDSEHLLEALRHVSRGEVVASTEWAAAVDGDPQAPGLSPRERQVLELYASGEKADRVARLLGVSRETVLDHIRRIRIKYAAVERPAHTKVELYMRAVEDGVLPGPV
jgi:DNA-binding NarL/FixJ family response regulator